MTKLITSSATFRATPTNRVPLDLRQAIAQFG
nr:MAG TPA: hypothetical protein [Caudoviricetes sp.]